MCNFDHCGQVTETHLVRRFLTYQCEELVCINQVKVSRHRKITCGDSIPVDERMAIFKLVLSLRAISQMSQQQFSKEANVALHQARMIFDSRMILFKLLYFLAHLLKDVSDGLFFIAPDPVHEGIA